MLFNSPIFLYGFLPVVAALFLAVRQRPRLTEGLLVAASLIFYAWYVPWLALLIGASLTGNYVAGRLIEAAPVHGRARVLTLAVVGNLACLGYFKYTDFLIDNFSWLTTSPIAHQDILLPPAISFFTFQQIAYLVDTKTSGRAERDFLHYALFVTFFPQLIAGPIVQHAEFMPQVKAGAFGRATANDAIVGLVYFAIGLFKKVVCADSLARLADSVFAAPAGSVGAADAWVGSLAFGLQIYFDFSGYSDMAVGLGRLFGVRLPVNFDSPYKARSIFDFWRRWNRTLSRFLHDYIYVPLGGSRRGRLRQCVNILVVMAIAGLWHGASWTFVAWGALHGLFMVIALLSRTVSGHDRSRTAPALAGPVLTFFALTATRVFFRSADFSRAWALVATLLSPAGPVELGRALIAPWPASLPVVAAAVSPLGLVSGLGWLQILLLVVWLTPNSQALAARVEARLSAPSRVDGPSRRAVSIALAISVGLVLAVAAMSVSEPREFIYFHF